MELFEISNKKDFMAKLLKSDLFDTFEVREVLIHAAFKAVIDGKRNKEFFNVEEDSVLSDYLSWKELRPSIYSLMQGSKSPTYFKIVFSTTAEKTATIGTDVTTLFLNIVFKDNKISCSTGVAYQTFTLDKTSEQTWNHKIQNFLFKYHFL